MKVEPTMARELRERLIQFAQAERLTGARALRVASRFERAHGGLVLLELAYQTRASVDEIEALAEARGVSVAASVLSAAGWVLSFVVTLFHWFTDLFPRGTRDIYAAMAERTARTVNAAADLRAFALRSGDAEIAAFCVDWMNARSALAARLTESLAADDAEDLAHGADPVEAHR